MAVKLNRSKIAGTVGTLALLFASNAWAQGDQPTTPPTTPPTGTGTDTPPAAGDDKGKDPTPADDKDKDKKKKSTTSTAAEGDQGGAPGQGTPGTGAAGASGGTTGGGLTVSLGSTPPKDTTTEDEDKKKKEAEEKKLFWADTSLYAQTSFSTTTIAPQQQLTQSSTVESWFLFQPRIALHKNWQLRGRATLSYEWTDTANTATTTKNEPMFGDTIISLFFRGIPEIPKTGIKTSAGFNLGLPTSKLSWARRMIVTPGLTLAFAKNFEKVLGGSVSLAASGSFSHPFYTHTTAAPINSSVGYSQQTAPFAGGGSASTEGALTGFAFGSASPENVLSFIFNVSAEWELPKKWGTISPMAVMFWTNSWKYTFSDVPLSGVTGTNVGGNVPRLGDRTNFAQSTYFNLAVDWSPNKWFTVEGGYYMFRNLIGEDGKLHNPFFDDMQDMRLYLAANFTLDQLYMAISGSDNKPAKAAHLNPFPAASLR